MRITYNTEYDRKLKTVFIGCGGHAYRNVYPTFQYAPVDLAAVCDIQEDLAKKVGRVFGAQNTYTDYRDMLEKEQPEAVFVVTNYDEHGHPRFPQIAIDAMEAGANVWIEKPPAHSSDEIRRMMATSEKTGKFVSVGLKKMFFPANQKAKQIITADPTFDTIVSITARYPERLPAYADRSDDIKMKSFLDHMVHPHSVLLLLAGKMESIFVQRHELCGAITAMKFRNGTVGSLHFATGQSGYSPFERTEIVGCGSNVIVDNNIRVTYHRKGTPEAGYGRAGSYFDVDGESSYSWEPEFSLGQLYNKGIFLLGYVQEVVDFCQCALENRKPTMGSLDDALELMKIYEAYRQPDGQVVEIPKD